LEELRENGRNDMKGFEERFPDSKKNSGSQMVIARKEGWREALKWVKKHHVELGIDDWTIIEQELKGK